MALKKETVLVWFALQTDKGESACSLMAYPKGRKKELLVRLEQAYAKKVRGNRLEHLDWKNLDEMTAPFVSEYTSTLSRVAGLCALSGAWSEKSSLVRDETLKRAAAFLKEQFSDVQFEIVFDRHQIRQSVLSSWVKKNQLHASLEETDAQTSLLMKSAALFGALLWFDLGECAKPVKQTLTRHLSLCRTWLGIDPAAMHDALCAQDIYPYVSKLFEQQPQWRSSGLLEKWLKKGAKAGTMGQILELIGQGADFSFFETLNPNRLERDFQSLLGMLNPAQSLQDLPGLNAWMENASKECAAALFQIAQKGPVSRRDALEQGVSAYAKDDGIGKELFSSLFSWLEDPKQYAAKTCSFYLFQHEQGLVIVQSSSMSIIRTLTYALDDDRLPLVERCVEKSVHIQVCERTMLHEVARILATQKRLSRVYADGATRKGLYRILLEHNAWLPVHELDDDTQKMLEQMTESRKPAMNAVCLFDTVVCASDTKDLQEGREEHSTDDVRFCLMPQTPLLPDDQYENLSKAKKRFLLTLDLPLESMRAAARLLLRGVSMALVKECAQTPGRLESLELGILYPRRDQKQLAHVVEPHEKRYLIANPTKSSALEAVHHLYESKIDPEWISYQLNRTMSSAKILQLENSYPGNRFGRGWIGGLDMSAVLMEKLLEQAVSMHSSVKEEELFDTLCAWLESAPSHIVRKAFANQLES